MESHSNKDRALRILRAWNAWRADRKLTIERALETSALVTMLLIWDVGYTVMCPAETTHVAQVRR